MEIVGSCIKCNKEVYDVGFYTSDECSYVIHGDKEYNNCRVHQSCCYEFIETFCKGKHYFFEEYKSHHLLSGISI